MLDSIFFFLKRDVQGHTKNSCENYADRILWPIEVLPGKVRNFKAEDLKIAKIAPVAASALYVVPTLFYSKKTAALTLKSIAQVPFLPTWAAQLASLAVLTTAVGFGSLKFYEYIYQKPYEKWESLKTSFSQNVCPHLTGFNTAAIALSALYLLNLAFHPRKTLALTVKSTFRVFYPPTSFWKASAFLICASTVAGYGLRAYGRITNPEFKSK